MRRAKRSADTAWLLSRIAGSRCASLANGCARRNVRLNRSTTSDDIVRATLDGIACRVHEVVTAMSQDAGQTPPHLKVDGGPSGNPYLMQMIADLLDIEVRVSAALEATAIGIANLAGVSALGTTFDSLAANWKAKRFTHRR